MKTKVLLILLGVTGLVVLAIFMRPSAPRMSTGPSTNGVVNTLNSTPATQQAVGSTNISTTAPSSVQTQVPNIQDNWAREPLPPGNTLQERLEELARRRGVSLNVLTQQALAQWSNTMNEAAREMNRPIEFYGKAVDEKDEPLSGADVRFSCLAFPEKHFTTNTVTDAQGKFALSGLTGVTLNVRVNKDGYEEVQGTNQNNFAYYSPTGNGFYSSPNDPVVFHLRKKE